MQLTQSVHKAAREIPDRMVLCFEGHETTHQVFADRVARAAAVLCAAGMQPDDRVGLLAQSSDQFIVALYAIWWGGGVVNPVNLRWTQPEIAYSLHDSGTSLLVADDVFAEMADALRGDVAQVLSLADLDADIAPVQDARRGGDDLAAIMYIGGTTGRSKGVMLSHAALMSNALSVLASAPHPGDTPYLYVAPFYHIAGMAAIVQVMLRRAPQVVIPGCDEAEILRQIETHKITDLFLVPTMLRRLLDHPDCKTRDCRSLRAVRYGAAPMDVALLADAMEAFPKAGFYHLYGQTEYSPVITCLPPANHTTAPDVPHMRSAGRFDADGYLYILDRLKDMIISGGENVYSTEVEDAVATFEGVVMCAVIGLPDAEWGERVHAVIQTRDGQPLDEAALTAHCRAQIAGFKLPRSFSFVGEMPLSPAGKILKRNLREALSKPKETSDV